MPTHQSQIETAISRLPQTAYGTARLSGADFRRILSDSQNVVDLSTNFENDASYDSGSDMANDIWAITNESSITLTPDFCFQDIGFFLLDALGGYSVTGSNPYTHVNTPQNMNTSRQTPTRTILKKYGGLKQLLMRDAVLQQFSITGGKTGRIKTSAQYRGSGYYEEDPAGYVIPAIADDREWGYNGQAFFRFNDSTGTKQKITDTAAGTASGAGTGTWTLTAAGMSGSPISGTFVVGSGDTPTIWAAALRASLKANLIVNNFFEVSGATTAIILEARVKAANDATMNLAIGAGGTGITAVVTSTQTTPGVAGSYQNYTCDLESWTLNINNPAADDGFRACSPYLVSGDPKSGAVRSEDLVGVRDYSFDFSARATAGDKMRTWLKAGTEVTLEIPIVGIDANDHSLRIVHTKCRVIEAKDMTDAGGGFIGVSGKVTLMSDSGTIPLTVTLINDVPSYAS